MHYTITSISEAAFTINGTFIDTTALNNSVQRSGNGASVHSMKNDICFLVSAAHMFSSRQINDPSIAQRCIVRYESLLNKLRG